MTKKMTKLKMTKEIRATIKKLVAAPASEIDAPEIARDLREGAEEEAEVLRRSRELGNQRVYRSR